MTKQEILQDGKYTQMYIAKKLYPDLKELSARAKFANKINNSKKRRFTVDEIERIKEILK